MQNKDNKNNQDLTLALIYAAQNAKTSQVRSRAILRLWEIYGQQVMGISEKNSRKVDANWDLHGLSHTDHQKEILSDTFMMFWKAVLRYDPTLNDSFIAYVAMNSKYQQQTEKRENAKRGNREVLVDFNAKPSKDRDGEEPQAIRDMAALKKCIYRGRPDTIVDARDTINRIERILESKYPKLLPYFHALYEVCQAYDKTKDTYVAAEQDYTRSNASQLRKKLAKVLEDEGLKEEIWLVIRALSEDSDLGE
jgi:hypothetical protein